MTPGSVPDWIGGVHSPTDGRAEPSLAGPAIAEAARKRGTTLHQDCAARGLETAAGKVSGVITEKGTIRTQAVLLAGGAWSGLFCRRHGLRLPQAGVKSTSFSTEAAPEVTSGGLSMPDVTIRRRLDGGYTVGLGGRGLLELSLQLLGDEASLADGAADARAAGLVHAYLWSRAETILAGTSEIQRNIIAEQMLGLPKA